VGAQSLVMSRGDEAIEWIELYCHIPEGKFVGQPVRLREWQKDIIRGIYDSPTRTAIVSFGRKNAKTTLSAFLLLLHMCGPESRPNSQLYSAAQSRDQAALLFSLASKVVRMSPDLRDWIVIRDNAKQLFCAERGTLYTALSADASTNYGKSPVFVVHDELGQVKGPRSEMYEALETAAGAHDDPLSIVISTQAPTDADLLSVLIDSVLKPPPDTVPDPKVKLFLYTADMTLDPFGEEAIRAANPAYGDFLNAVEVRSQADNAKRMPAREAAYRNLVLNQRVNVSNPLIARAVWEACSGEPDDDAFRNETWVGLDLSARNDLTALVYGGRDADGMWSIRAEFFAPELGVKERAHRDRVPYDIWAQEGYLTLTPGASVDYAIVAQRLAEICDEFPVREVAFDRWRIDVLKNEIAKLGVELSLVPFGQGFKDMTPAVDALEAALLNGKLRHGNNPVMNMCAANAVATRDPAGNRKIDKSKSTGRIDGIVGLAMLLGRAASAEPPDEYVSGRLVAL
jgi:phage terminase large subunit-like protein